MRTIIGGSRHLTDYRSIVKCIAGAPFTPTVVISGGARGVDTLGERWAAENNVPTERFPSDWAKHGKTAGPVRNQEMAGKAEALIAIWDGISPGTRDMIEQAKKAGLMTHVCIIESSG